MKNCRLCSFIVFVSLISGAVPVSVYSQLKSDGFPFAIGNKWFYQFESVYTDFTKDPPFIHVQENVVKEIVDTVSDGFIVDHYRRNPYSFISQEKWNVSDGKFTNSAITYGPLYDIAVTKESTWVISSGSPYIFHFIAPHKQVTIFALARSVQSSGRLSIAHFTLYDSIYTALGIGTYYQKIAPAEPSPWPGIYTISRLTGMLINGQLYGDSTVTGVNDELRVLPASIGLDQNYPNPFNPTTTISFVLPSAESNVSLKIYDMLGREVAVLFQGELEYGEHSYTWDAAGYPSGMYIYRLQAGDFFDAKKLVLMK